MGNSRLLQSNMNSNFTLSFLISTQSVIITAFL